MASSESFIANTIEILNRGPNHANTSKVHRYLELVICFCGIEETNIPGHTHTFFCLFFKNEQKEKQQQNTTYNKILLIFHCLILSYIK